MDERPETQRYLVSISEPPYLSRQHSKRIVRFRDVSNPPKQITNRQGMILLRSGDISTPGTWSILACDIRCRTVESPPVILAKGFDILLGRTEITVPWVLTRDDYSLVCEY